ncbi:MAG: SDR family oxidoreductase [Mesorhizobium sp.]|uniref:SDR family NAD(P)-dependent oxidoreductase n=2 Tax=unclassified Mesorhizobium TaxID=325217 RepID=UPI000FD55861|nr:SDR family oxidoreductase [Mesorhizobium sp.]RVC56570.1 SDR family oxidoreductase [Mesorhizobium sp. M4B.F.Ca.ET.088.02.2.1]RWF25054.1 MAG: SDR family oxidoreductase [Mesorhizobium sp.]RWF37215.1 MAG: SDR family oxidoreductase [Mesorhizobium sp.]TIX11945.1 MAG: SDR family oxidoreductase [Mesorhizobium sp.]TJW02261.1 MAG: SDR family oxidoreductase [Mesorhizobium sp.]
MSTKDNKGTAVITGASSGIGAVYADRLAGQGYDLVLVARRADRLQEVADRLAYAYGRKVKTIVADLADDSDLRRVEQAIATDESVTLLINNAGMGGIETVADADADAAESMIKVNVVALTRLTRAALPGLLARNHGAIVNIASVVAYGIAVGGIYSGTKAYVVNFTEALQKEVAGTAVRAQVVLPGPIRTEFWDASGISLDRINQDWVMSADDLVDAALAGLAQGETVTAPGLADPAGLDTYLGARDQFYGSLFAGKPATRYAV